MLREFELAADAALWAPRERVCFALSHARRTDHADMPLTHALNKNINKCVTCDCSNSAAMGNRRFGGAFFEPWTWPRAELRSCQLGGRTWNRQGPSNYCLWKQTSHTRLQPRRWFGVGGAKTTDVAEVFFRPRRGKGRPGLSSFHAVPGPTSNFGKGVRTRREAHVRRRAQTVSHLLFGRCKIKYRGPWHLLPV